MNPIESAAFPPRRRRSPEPLSPRERLIIPEPPRQAQPQRQEQPQRPSPGFWRRLWQTMTTNRQGARS